MNVSAGKKPTRAKSKGGAKRRKEKFPGLDPELHPRPRREYIDADYTDQLTDEEKKFYSDFIEEYYGGNFQHSGKKLHRKAKQRRECYNRNNARNRDMLSISKVSGLVSDINDKVAAAIDAKHTANPEDQENAVVELLDAKIAASKEE